MNLRVDCNGERWWQGVTVKNEVFGDRRRKKAGFKIIFEHQFNNQVT